MDDLLVSYDGFRIRSISCLQGLCLLDGAFLLLLLIDTVRRLLLFFMKLFRASSVPLPGVVTPRAANEIPVGT
jgi:hypothetical protein